MDRAKLMKLAMAAASLDLGFIKWHLARLADETAPNSSWKKEASKMLNWLNNLESKPPYKVFTHGNSKLPFYSFSVLPVVTCPGAGECAIFCYSFKAWRYPAAFFRQLQNTILVKMQSYHIVDAFYSIPKNVHVRLYVDGDFDTVDTVRFWMNLVSNRSDLQVYGYSKSWNELLQFDKENKKHWPNNYRLNLSSGHNHKQATKKRVAKLPITRGEFIAVEIDKKNVGKYDSKEYKDNVRASAKNIGIDKAFVCPGKCGTCTKTVHACGSDKFNNLPVLIGIH